MNEQMLCPACHHVAAWITDLDAWTCQNIRCMLYERTLVQETPLGEPEKQIIAHLVQRMHLMLERHNQEYPGQRVDQVDLALHLPEYALTWRNTWHQAKESE